jgi:hypothetical protein
MLQIPQVGCIYLTTLPRDKHPTNQEALSNSAPLGRFAQSKLLASVFAAMRGSCTLRDELAVPAANMQVSHPEVKPRLLRGRHVHIVVLDENVQSSSGDWERVSSYSPTNC